MAGRHFESEGRGSGTVAHLLAGGEMLPSQLASVSDWSSEKKLAAAVFTAALIEVRERHADPSYRRRVAEDLRWIDSDDVEWPFSFIRLCQLFDLEPGYVRGVVRYWLETPTQRVPRQLAAPHSAAYAGSPL